MGLFTGYRGHGPRYDLHRPWVLVSYRAGGGRPKRVEFYETQAQAAHALRAAINEDEGAPGDRYAFKVMHVTSQWGMDSAFDYSLGRSGYYDLALLQYRSRHTYRQSHGWASRSRRARRAR